ncbi:flagellar hook-length control protein FliK [Myxococcus virescens]|uniref:flagellar hook-length control protein FliK n=1 Tax=Myxococcus virescens TaxID=83456 RepID=UPI003DA491DC
MPETTPPAPGPKRRRLGHVARGGEINTLNIRFPGRYYAFVTEREGADDDPLYLRLECVERDWMDRVWNELEKQFDPGDFLRFFNAVINGRRFEDFYDALTLEQLNLFYVVYYWFLRRVIDDGNDSAPVSVFEFELAPGDPLRDDLYETDWFHLELQATPASTRPDGLFVRAGSVRRAGVHTVRGFTPDTDSPPAERWLRSFLRVEDRSDGGLTQGALKALHFPLPAPPPPPPPSRPGGPGGSGGSGPIPEPPIKNPFAIPSAPLPIPVSARVATPALARWMRAAARQLSQQVRAFTEEVADFFDDWMPPPGGPVLAFAGAAGPALTSRAVPRERSRPGAPPPTAHAYVGDGAPNPMDASDPNGLFAPFVGLFNVGQGACSVLYDNQGRAIVYYDFGSPANGQQGTFPIIPQGHCVGPCMCNGPLIILSHWDMDHCDLGRYYPESFRCRWLAPQQHMGTVVCRDTVARVVHDGGEFYIWAASGRPGTAASPRGTPSSWNRPGGSHMRFPWGFVERNYREGAQNPLASGSDPRNNSGLALYVCVRDAPGGAAAVAAGPVATDANNLGGNGRGLVTIGGGAPPGWVGAVFAGPNLPGIGGGLAALLAAMGPAGGNPNPAALLARRQSAAATAAVGPGGPGAGLTARQRLVIATLAVAHPGLAAATAMALGRAAEVAADAVAVAGGTLPQMAAAAGAAVIVASGAPGTAVATFTAMGTAAAGGAPLMPGSAGALALAHVQGAIVGAPAASPVTTAANTASGIVPQGGEAVRAAVEAVVRTHAPAPLPGLSLEGAVARAAGVSNPAAVCKALAPPLPPTLQGEAPFHANERFVLLTGDVNYQYIPAQRRPFAAPGGGAPGGAVPLPYAPTAHPPVVVGLTATHHGSNKVGANDLNPDRIPWAPNTLPTRAAAVAHAASALPNPNIRRAATAAAAAAALPLPLPANLANLAAAAERAAYAASAGAFTPLVVARAAAAAVVLENAVPNTPQAQFDHLGAVSAGPPPAVPALVGATAVAWGLVTAALGGGGGGAAAVPGLGPVVAVPGGPQVVRAATEAVLMARGLPNAHRTASARRAVEQAHVGARPGAPQPVLQAVAATVAVRRSIAQGGTISVPTATAIVQASRLSITTGAGGTVAALAGAGIANLPAVTHPYFATAVAAIPNPPLAAVQAALGLPRSVPIDPANAPFAVANAFAPSPVLPEIILDALLSRGQSLPKFPLALVEIAAALAAIGPGASLSEVAAVVEAARAAQNGQAAGAPPAAGHAHAAADRIGYSYGVAIQTGGAAAAPPFAHRYLSQGVGHPAHLAIDKYQRRGWAVRRNTSMHADQSAQPDNSPRGHHALGWELAPPYEGPLRPASAATGTLSRTCHGCKEVAAARAAVAVGAGTAPATAVATAIGVVPAAAAATAPAAGPVNAAQLGRLGVPAARAARRSLEPAIAARAAVPFARAAVAGVAAAHATSACIIVSQAVLAARWPAATARGAVVRGGPLSPAAAMLVGVPASAAEAVTAAYTTVLAAPLALPPTDLAAVVAAVAVSLGEPPLAAVAATVALPFLGGTGAAAHSAALATAAGVGIDDFAAAIVGGAHACALGANLPAPVAARVAAISAMAGGAPTPTALDAVANAISAGPPVAAHHALLMGTAGTTLPAIAAVVAAAAGMAHAGVTPPAAADASTCHAAAAATVPGITQAAVNACAATLAGGAIHPNPAAVAGLVAASTPTAAAAVSAASAVLTATGAAPPALGDAAVCYASAAAAVTAAMGGAAAAAEAAANTLAGVLVPAVGNTAVTAATAANSSEEAAAAVAAAAALVTADALTLPTAAQSAACYAAAAAAAGVPALAANAAAGTLALAGVTAATDANTALVAGAAPLACATVAAAMVVTQLAVGGTANHRAVAAAASASAIGVPVGPVDQAAQSLSVGMAHPISVAIAESASMRASGASEEAAAAMATVRVLEPRSAPLAAVAAASAGVPAADAAATAAIRLFNV